MPSGKAPFPKKSVVDAGKADKAEAVTGGFKRTSESNEGSNRKITYPGTNTMSKYPGPSATRAYEGSYNKVKSGD